MKAPRVAIVLSIGLVMVFISRGVFLFAKHDIKPQALVTPTDVDLGEVRVGEPVMRTFVLRNAGGARLLITNLKTSCQCAVAELPSRVVPPGTSVSLYVTFKATGPGKKDQRVVIETNELSNRTHVLKIRAIAVSTKPGGES